MFSDSQAELEILFRKCRRGDASSWESVVERFQSLVYSIPRRMGLNDDDASDVFQATFLALYKNLDRIESPLTLPKWLSVTASRESYRLIRQKRAGQRVEFDDKTLDEVIADEDQTVGEQVGTALMVEAIGEGLDKISERCKHLLKLLYRADEVSYQDISQELEMPVGSIGPTRARCLDKLRSVLGKSGFFDEMYQDEQMSSPHA